MRNQSELPADWKWVKLGEVADKIFDGPFGSHLKSSDYVEDGIRVIRLENIGVRQFKDEYKTFVTEEKYASISKHTVARGDIIFSSFIADEIRVAILPEFIEKAINKADCFCIRTTQENIDRRYLCYFLSTKAFYNQLVNEVHGATRPRVNTTQLKSSLIPLCSLEGQQRIVAKLEELFSELDTGLASLKTAAQQLKTYRQAVLKWAFEGKLTNDHVNEGELPAGWKWVKVLEIGKVETGSTPSTKNPKFYGNDFPFYKPTDLEAGYNVRRASDNLSELGINQARFLPVNSILVTCIGATIGKTGIIRREGASNQQINAIIPSKDLNPNFIYYQAIGPLFQEAIKENASATTLPILNKTKFQNLGLVVCSLEEQHRIVQEIESRLSVCDKLEETIAASLGQAEALRQSILKKAFTGKLVAPVLNLDDIRA